MPVQCTSSKVHFLWHILQVHIFYFRTISKISRLKSNLYHTGSPLCTRVWGDCIIAGLCALIVHALVHCGRYAIWTVLQTLLVHCNVSTTWTRPVEFESVERVRIYFNNSVLFVHCTRTATRTWTRPVKLEFVKRVRINGYFMVFLKLLINIVTLSTNRLYYRMGFSAITQQS